MTALTDSRKRSREEDAGSVDFMPLSKRITNLHINTTSSSSSTMQSDNDITDYNMNLNQHQQQTLQHHQTLQFQNHPNQFGSFVQSNGESNQFSDFSNVSHPIDAQERQYRQYLSECNNARSSSSCTNHSSNDNVNHMPPPYNQYDPELSQDENPFYYNKNKLLYDLYLERVRRHQ